MNSSTKDKEQRTQGKLSSVLLDNDFFEIAIREEQERKRRAAEAAAAAAKPVLTEEDLAQAESTGYAQGLADGKAQATEALKGELNQHLGRLLDRLNYIDDIKQEYLRITYSTSFKLLQKMVNHLFADISTNHTEEMLEKALKTCLEYALEDVPLLAHINPSTLDYARKIAAQGDLLKPYEGRVKFIADTNIAPGDCLLEWDAAGVDVRLAHAMDDVKKLLAGKLAGIQRGEIELPPDPIPTNDILPETSLQPEADQHTVPPPQDGAEIEAKAPQTPEETDDIPDLPDAFDVTIEDEKP